LQVEAELVAERERASRDAERAREAIRQKETELAAIEAERRKEVRDRAGLPSYGLTGFHGCLCESHGDVFMVSFDHIVVFLTAFY
jgi:hypothetical protein